MDKMRRARHTKICGKSIPGREKVSAKALRWEKLDMLKKEKEHVAHTK